ncbi:MAG: diacylglycerol kinase family lipid kinase [Chloroflexi bacterium]|nr:diacylglycerol kinase family lipid kinase [Chloroflexota bacterium]
MIVNPTAGRGDGESSIPVIERCLSEAGLDFVIERTTHPWHAADLAQGAAIAGYDVVASAGGDGTANEIINGLMRAKKMGHSQAALAVLTVGRGNDFAFSMGIPAELEMACQALMDNRRRKIDIGLVTGGLFPDGRYFGNGVGIGFDAVVGFEALKMKYLHGFASYIVAALKTIFLYFKAPQVQIDYHGNSIKLPALMVSIMNGRRMGGGFMMAPAGQADDGLLDLIIAREVSRPKIFALIGRFMSGTQADHEAIQTEQIRQVSIKALDGILPAHADGETLCTDGTQLVIEILPNQIDLIYAPAS